MNYEVLNPLNVNNWDELIAQYPDATFFHTQSWAKVLSETYGYEPKYFALFANGALSFLLPMMDVKSIFTGRRGISLPFTDYCEPVIGSRDIPFREVHDLLVEYGTRAGWKFVEIRGGKEFIQGPSFSSFYRHTLDISQGVEQIFSNFTSSTRRNVKKSAKDGVKVELCSTSDSIREFYRLNCLTRKKHGLPPQPYGFFKKIFDHVISKNHGLVALALYQGQVIASRLYLQFGNTVIDKYAASNTAYHRLKPNNLILWEAIKRYSEQGYKSLCLGRTAPDHIGLRRFKIGFGAEQKVVNYYRYDLRKNQFVEGHTNATEFYNNFFRIMPMSVSRVVGEALYRHVG